MKTVAIRGDGVAARCCAHLLSKAGFAVAIGNVSRPRLPAIVLSETALALLRDVFDQPDLLRHALRIERRLVVWQRGAEPVTLPHSAVVVSEHALLHAIGGVPQAEIDSPEWEIFASPPLEDSVEHRFGSRIASAARAKTKDPAACVVESVEQGWLFLIPGWLLSVGAPAARLLNQSHVVAKQIEAIGSETGRFPASPRIVWPLGGSRSAGARGWLACGSAAMAFDPICGDGTAHAVREAILASAVIRFSGRLEDVVAHYQSRLLAGFERHLKLSLEFYRSGFGGAWWDRECGALRNGIAWCGQRTAPPFRFRLSGFELQPLS